MANDSSAMPPRWTADAEQLIRQIDSNLAMPDCPPVNLSLYSHAATSLALHRLVYDARYQGKAFPIVYMDGSISKPFPIGTLSPDTAPAYSDLPVLTVGLMSFRHPDLDFLVDYYVTRNRELADEVTMADEEELSFRRSSELLNDPAFRLGIHLRALHTGLEPMVVGFYRAVAVSLKEHVRKYHLRSLVVEPWILKPGHRAVGGKIRADSPGAKLENYVACPVWR